MRSIHGHAAERGNPQCQLSSQVHADLEHHRIHQAVRIQPVDVAELPLRIYSTLVLAVVLHGSR